MVIEDRQPAIGLTCVVRVQRAFVPKLDLCFAHWLDQDSRRPVEALSQVAYSVRADRTWAEVEAAIGSLRGRRFFGTFDPATHEYRVCVQWREGDEAGALGLELGAIPGGRYACERLEGAPPAVYRLIQPAFKRLAASGDDRDPSRPSIEFYRRHDVIELLLPLV